MSNEFLWDRRVALEEAFFARENEVLRQRIRDMDIAKLKKEAEVGIDPDWWTPRTLSRTRAPYSSEFRRRMVDLVRAGRDPDDLAREFEPTAQSIRNWVSSADKKVGRWEGGAARPECC